MRKQVIVLCSFLFLCFIVGANSHVMYADTLSDELPSPNTRASYYPDDIAEVDLSNYFEIIGDARVHEMRKNIVVPIPASTSKAGAMWGKRKIDLAKSFDTAMYMWMSRGSSRSLADGVTFTLHNDARDLSQVIGAVGQGISVYGGSGSRNTYIKNALTVEIDPYYNSDYDRDVRGTHVAIMKPGSYATMLTQRAHNKYGTPLQNLSIDDTDWKLFRISWETADKGITGRLNVSLQRRNSNGTLTNIGTIKSNLINVQEEFGSKLVNWGFTASSGALYGEYNFAMKDMPQIEAGKLKKRVRNISKNEEFFKEMTSARQDQLVEYELSYDNSGADWPTKENLSFLDKIDNEAMSYERGSTTVLFYKTTGTIIEKKVPDTCWNEGDFRYIVEGVREGDSVVIRYQVKTKAIPQHKKEIKNTFEIQSVSGIRSTSEAVSVHLQTMYTITEKYQTITGYPNTIIKDIQPESIQEKEGGAKYQGEAKEIILDELIYECLYYQINDGSKYGGVRPKIEELEKDTTIKYTYAPKKRGLFIRQRVLNSLSELVVPNLAIMKLELKKKELPHEVIQTRNFFIDSTIYDQEYRYMPTTIVLNKTYTLQTIVPQNYKNVGYTVASRKDQADNMSELKPGVPTLDLSENQQDYWINIYIQPDLGGSPYVFPYSWDYKTVWQPIEGWNPPR